MSTKKQNTKMDPTRRPKNLPRLNFEDERCNHSTFAKEQRLGKIDLVHKHCKQNVTNTNLTCITLSEEGQVRKQPDEVNKCPSVLTKSVSW